MPNGRCAAFARPGDGVVGELHVDFFLFQSGEIHGERAGVAIPRFYAAPCLLDVAFDAVLLAGNFWKRDGQITRLLLRFGFLGADFQSFQARLL